MRVSISQAVETFRENEDILSGPHKYGRSVCGSCLELGSGKC